MLKENNGCTENRKVGVVLILILMEHAQREITLNGKTLYAYVLILILMEHAQRVNH